MALPCNCACSESSSPAAREPGFIRLTKERAKPAVPFGGKYRIVDFVLSNFINSGIYSIYVLTQFRSQSLLQHLNEGWQIGGILKNQFIIPVPAQMRSAGETWYQGTADAIYQNINLIEQAEPHIVAIFGADHIYRMNIAHMIDGASAHRAPPARSPPFRCPESTPRIRRDRNRPATTAFSLSTKRTPMRPPFPAIPTRSSPPWATICSHTRTLLKALHEDAADPDSSHDFGRDILPKLVAEQHAIYAYDFQTNKIPGEPPEAQPYWRDVGTIEAYWEANMDLRAVKPALNLYNRQWPLRTSSYPDPPAKFTFDDENRRGEAIDSIVSGGCILSGGRVRNSVLGRGVRVHAGRVGGGQRDSRQLRHRPPREDPPRDSRQERPRPAGFHDRLRCRTGPTALPRHRNRHRGGGRKPRRRSTSPPFSCNCGVDTAYLNRFLNAKSTPTYPFSSRVRIAAHRRLKSHSTWINCVLVLETSEI